MIKNTSKKVLIDFSRHGLGDACQFTCVLQHLREHYPDVAFDVRSKIGKASCFNGLVRKSFCREIDFLQDSYDQKIRLDWWECNETYHDVPSTKVSKCLKEVFGIQPVTMPYVINFTDDDRQKVEAYVATLPDQPFVLIHYQGNSSAENKNLEHEPISRLCKTLLKHQFTPVILDFDFRSPLPDGKTIFCPDKDNDLWGHTGTGDGAVLAALISRAALFVGVDSGPLHASQSTSTPIVSVWTKHHPLHFSDISGDVIHLIPENHQDYIRGDKAVGLEFFTKNYQHRTYRDVGESLIRLVCERLGLPDEDKYSTTAYGREYYEEHKAANIDYAFYGDWQRSYTRWLADVFDLNGKQLLDVACACGSICQGFQDAGAKAHGIDLNNFMIEMGREKFRVESLNVCDAVNLHLFSDESFDFIHSQQAFEHFRPELVPFILKELWRVMEPGSILFSVHDTQEQHDREGRIVGAVGEDPTHSCVRSNGWWDQQREQAGFVDARHRYEPLLRSHPGSYFQHYHWDFICWQKPLI